MTNLTYFWKFDVNKSMTAKWLHSGPPRRIWARQGPIFYSNFFWPFVSYKSILKPQNVGKARTLQALVAVAAWHYYIMTAKGYKGGCHVTTKILRKSLDQRQQQDKNYELMRLSGDTRSLKTSNNQSLIKRSMHKWLCT